MQLLSVKFFQIATAIDDTNAQIAALQTRLSELQEHQQQLLSVEQACQSALAQVGTALAMLNHVDPSEIPTFKAAIDAQFGTDAIAFLPTGPDPETAVASEPEPEPTPEGTVDVEATAVATEPEPTPASEPTQAVTIEELKGLSIQKIRKLAAQKGAGGSGKQAEIAARLAGIVTRTDLANLA